MFLLSHDSVLKIQGQLRQFLAIKFFIILNLTDPSSATFGRRGKRYKYTELFYCLRLTHTCFD